MKLQRIVWSDFASLILNEVKYFLKFCSMTQLYTIYTVDRRSRRAAEFGRQGGPIPARKHSPRVSLERKFACFKNCRGIYANVFRYVT